MNEKIIQISNVNGIIYGLTDNGELCVFDNEIGHWVYRASEEIKDIHQVNSIRKRNIELTPSTKYDLPEKKSEKKNTIAIFAFLIVVTILLSSFVAIYFIKNHLGQP